MVACLTEGQVPFVAAGVLNGPHSTQHPCRVSAHFAVLAKCPKPLALLGKLKGDQKAGQGMAVQTRRVKRACEA